MSDHTKRLGRKLAAMIEGVNADIRDLRRRVEGVVRHGRIVSVDGGAHTAAVEIGNDLDGTPMQSPDLPYQQHGGAFKRHSMPSPGQHVMILSPSGDLQQGVVVPGQWNDANPSPSKDPGEHVDTFGAFTMSLKGDAYHFTGPKFVFEAGGVTVTISGEGVIVTGGTMKHDGHKIDKDHKHTQVLPGPALSGPPE